MKIAILGTGTVGRAHAARLAELGHEVIIGTNDVEKTKSVTKVDGMGNQPFSIWNSEHSGVKLATFANAARQAEIVYDALSGRAALKVLTEIKEHLTDKILVDIANPLDFSKGMPPSLFVSNTDSLGEQIQKALPKTKVVKTLNTVTASLQANPTNLADGDHSIFIGGDDDSAKATVTQILKSYGWKDIIDLGGIISARGTEMYLPLWLQMWGAIGNTVFNIKIVK